jgi:uncharacterized membrane protein
MEVLQGVSLIAAVIAMGLMAGVFGLYAHTIMPGLARTDDRTFVGAFQAIDRAIINPWFIPVFFGTLLLTGVATGLHLGDEGEDVLPWTLAAFLLYLAVVIITIRINVPRNDAIKSAGEPDEIAGLAEVRQRFDEASWARWNVVRAVACTVALGCLAWAAVEYGRTVL